MIKLPDIDRLREFLGYNPETGAIYWIKQKSNNAPVGKEFTAKDSKGYYLVFFDGKNYKAHRIAYYLYYGEIPNNMQIDHINGVKTDNSIKNLRLATNSENHMNIKCKGSNTGIKNIMSITETTRGKTYERYKVEIAVLGKRHQKRFPHTPEGLKEAIAYRDQKLKELHGEFARTE